MGIQSTASAKQLLFKKPVSKELLTANNVDQSTNITLTKGTLPLYDENGNILGYVPIYANANLA